MNMDKVIFDEDEAQLLIEDPVICPEGSLQIWVENSSEIRRTTLHSNVNYSID